MNSLRTIDKRIKKYTNHLHEKRKGWVEVTRHQSKYMYQPLVEKLLQHKDKGTSCVLTQTNEEGCYPNGSFAETWHKQQIDTINGWLPFLEYGRDEIFFEIYRETDKNTFNSGRIMGGSQTCNLFHL